MIEQIRAGLVVFRDDHSQPPFRKAHLFPLPEETDDNADADAEDDSDRDDAGLQVMSSVIYKQAQVSVKLLRKMFDGEKVFTNPKDHEVLMRLIQYCTRPDDLILDSFAGSGGTGHAVLQANYESNTRRRFILVEMDADVAAKITSERLRRAICGYADQPALNGGFRYCKLGDALFDESRRIRESVKFADLAAHVFFTETGSPIPKRANGRTPLLGVHEGVAVYLLFNGVMGDRRVDGGNVLTSPILRELPEHDGPRVIYGEGCRLGRPRLKREDIVFKQVPYGIKVN